MRSLNSRKSGSKFRARQTESYIERLEGRTLLSSVVVNTIADSTDAKGSSTVSLRDAIAIANASTTPTTITFSTTVFATAKTILIGSTLNLTNTSEATTVTGPSARVTVDSQNKLANGTDIFVETGVTATMSNLTASRGAITGSGTTTLNNVTVSGAIFTPNGIGAGIENTGTMLISNSVISGNTLTNGSGAGFWNSGKATLTDVTVSGNQATKQGAGIYNSGTLTINRGTISGNELTGGSDAGGGLFNVGTATLTDVTIANNTTGAGITTGGGSLGLYDCTIYGNGALIDGGGVYVSNSAVTVANTIIAGNTAAKLGQDVYGPFKSLGHNLVGKTDSSTGWISTDEVGTNSKPLAADLGALANNGGPTQTLLPLAGSPAIDHGSNALIPKGVTTDQRGLPRTYNGTVDIGAVEVQPLIQIKGPANQKATQGVGISVTLGSFTQYTNAGPFKDTITWGDGSASTILSLTAAGTIPTTNHVFAKSGTITVTEIITDAKGNKSNTVTFTETVAAPVGSISGTVFDDANGDGKIDNGEFGVGLWTVYLDLNKDGKLDTGDKSVTTDINGKFSFTGLAAGTYVVRVVPVTGTVATKPTTNMLTITLAAGQNSTGNLFGEKAVA